MLTLEQWFKGGQRIPIAMPTPMPITVGGDGGGGTGGGGGGGGGGGVGGVGGAGEVERVPVFCRAPAASAEGADRPVLTMLHGFPTSSWDYARLQPLVEAGFWPLSLDFVGAGNSDKPPSFRYGPARQADVVEAVWARFRVRKSFVVAHDRGVLVALELLARRQRLAGGAEVLGVTLLNGPIYADLERPSVWERTIGLAWVGEAAARGTTEGVFRREVASRASEAFPLGEDELAQHWQAMVMRGGQRVLHRVASDGGERARLGRRWEAALEAELCPVQCVWGARDRVVGVEAPRRLAARRPSVRVIELSEVGHSPHLEREVAVADAVLAMRGGAA